MNLLLPPYIFNIVVLVPVGLLTLFGGAKGGQVACQGKFPESEGFRTILGSLWTAIPSGSGLGLFFPATMSPLLLIQVIYTSRFGSWCSSCHACERDATAKSRGGLRWFFW